MNATETADRLAALATLVTELTALVEGYLTSETQRADEQAVDEKLSAIAQQATLLRNVGWTGYEADP